MCNNKDKRAPIIIDDTQFETIILTNIKHTLSAGHRQYNVLSVFQKQYSSEL